MRVGRKNESIPPEWQQAIGRFIPKEQNSSTIDQFRSIALLNVKGKVFFSVLERRITNFLKDNRYIDTSCQKAGIPGFPGCLEHSSMIWEQIQGAKRDNNLYISFLFPEICRYCICINSGNTL